MNLTRSQYLDEPFSFAEISRFFVKVRTRDARATVPARDAAVRVLPEHIIDKEILERDDLAFEANNLRDTCDLAASITKARRLNDDIDR